MPLLVVCRATALLTPAAPNVVAGKDKDTSESNCVVNRY